MRKKMTSLLLLFVFLAATISGFCKENDPYLVKDFDQKSGGNLQVNTSGGGISITGTNENKASITVIIKDQKGNTDKARIEELLKNYNLDIRQEKNTIYAIAEKKDKNWHSINGLSISFQIKVPRQTECNLNTSGGSIAINNIKGDTKAITAGGSIAIDQFLGDLDAKTSGGSIKLNDAEGKLTVQTSGGSINLTKVAGDIQAQTSGGSIAADIQKLGKYLTLETSGGSVKATIPGNKGLDLDLTGSNVKADLANFKGESKRTKITGSVNGGGIPVKLSTSAGSTQLNYRM